MRFLVIVKKNQLTISWISCAQPTSIVINENDSFPYNILHSYPLFDHYVNGIKKTFHILISAKSFLRSF